MTAVLRRTPAPAPPLERLVPGWRARTRWSSRLMRRGAMFVWLTAALYMAVEVMSYRSAYPDAASRQKLLDLSSSTAVRMLQGEPGAIDTAGGFAAWDGGWMLMLICGCWAMLTATRLSRGEEDAGRADLVLSRPVTARQAVAAHISTLGVAAAAAGAAAALAFVLFGEKVTGALVFGLGLAGFMTVTAMLGLLVGQVFAPRRQAVSAGLGLLAAAFVLRVVANSSDGRRWLLAFTPFGWTDRLRPFGDARWVWLLPAAGAAAAFAVAALALCDRRDTGAALLRESAHHRSKLQLLGSAPGFGWRMTSGALVAWALILAVVALVFGMMSQALLDFIEKDDSYRKMLESMGVDMSVPAVGYVSYIASFFALPFAAFLGWRIGAARQEEAEGRLDNLLVRGVVRWRWLTVTAFHAFIAGALLVAASGSAVWVGTRLVDAPLTTWQVFEPMVGTLPLVALFTGIAVLVFGVAPRATVLVPVTLAVLGYLLETFGTLLHWPSFVVGISPFHHLARLPGQPITMAAVIVMVGIGFTAAALGVAAFARRDLVAA